MTYFEQVISMNFISIRKFFILISSVINFLSLLWKWIFYPDLCLLWCYFNNYLVYTFKGSLRIKMRIFCFSWFYSNNKIIRVSYSRDVPDSLSASTLIFSLPIWPMDQPDWPPTILTKNVQTLSWSELTSPTFFDLST